MLDDPYVSADTKESLLVAYLRGGGADSDRAKAYADRYRLSIDDYFDDDSSLDEVYTKATGESEEAGYHDRQVSAEVQRQSGQLGGLVAPAVGGGGVASSDEVFDVARPALAVFERFVPVDAKVPSDSRGVNGPLDFGRDVQA
ncbi:MAG: hypothetical protein ACJ72N_03845, partial [Labedaea sp.]